MFSEFFDRFLKEDDEDNLETADVTSNEQLDKATKETFEATLESTDVFVDDLLEDEKVLITGGGTGIGKDIAIGFANHGADVAVASRNMDHLRPVAEQVERLGQESCARTVDVRDRSSVDALRDYVIDELGEITCLINNAGANFITPTEDISEDDWESVVGTILDGTANCSISIGQHMIENDGGTIIANGATNSEKGAPFHAHSGAGKAGVHNLMQTIAAEWAQYGIRANTVAPGIIETESATEITGGSFPEYMLKFIAADRFGQPGDCVPVFVFLASEASSYITGSYIPVDGGHLLAPTSL